ncbi:MAG TPA: LytTR family transcriptional regulator [Candidatus Limosilactobacillus merdipullorum]|uniref:LytTR family transcriptional regulator n=1 Tax=Candidatus Limosilactobacillus merdipullorum TaxID=2838653 RepID=A0A9D1QQ09_9LACO|nr:LytTR family transcriptional regulator [Candidatus Limosilactobacillus merdipullorum]
MKIKFFSDSSLNDDELNIEISAKTKTPTVRQLINYLQQFGQEKRHLLPIKTADRIVTIKYDDLIKIEVHATRLTFYTTTDTVETTGRLYKVLASLNNDFVQVSRHAVININYLQSIEDGFAGNMVAILQGRLKTDVLRRYLPLLEKELGL